MSKIKDYFKKKPHMVLTVPTVLCFITFVTNMVHALKDGNIDTNELHALMASADGFETVVLFLVMLVLKDKKK